MRFSLYPKKQKKLAHKKGFTLLETLVAIFLLTLALTGPIYIATLAIRSSVESRDNISAYYLAEEVVEAIRNIRDTRSLSREVSIQGAGWLRDLSPGIGSVTSPADCFNRYGDIVNVCSMSRLGSENLYIFETCIGGLCAPLTFNPASNDGIIYGGQGAGSINSKFTREFYIESAMQDPAANTAYPVAEANLVVTVRWQDKGRDRQFQLVEHLHNLEYVKYEN